MLITVSTKYSQPGVPLTTAILAVRHSNASTKSSLSGEDIRQLRLRRRGVGWGLLPATWGSEIFLEAGTGTTTGGSVFLLCSEELGHLLVEDFRYTKVAEVVEVEVVPLTEVVVSLTFLVTVTLRSGLFSLTRAFSLCSREIRLWLNWTFCILSLSKLSEELLRGERNEERVEVEP